MSDEYPDGTFVQAPPVKGMVDIDMSGINAACHAIADMVIDLHKNGLVVTAIINGQSETITVQVPKQ